MNFLQLTAAEFNTSCLPIRRLISSASYQRKATSYLEIPVFNFTYNAARNYSFIVAQYDYAHNKSFQLKTLPSGTGKNFVPVIRWRIEAKAFRYKIWQNIGELFYGVNLYNGEIIPRNFVIELWSTITPNVISNASAIHIETTEILDTEDFCDVGPFNAFTEPTLADLYETLPHPIPQNYDSTSYWLTN